jgi:hypothetical protein
MSLTGYVYVGVYLELKSKREKKVVQITRDSRGNFSDAVYDPYTGEKLTKMYENIEYISQSVDIDVEEFEQLFNTPPNDIFFKFQTDSEEYDILVFSKKSKYSTEQKFNADTIELHANPSVELISEVETKYKNYINYYKHVGFDVTVKFGVVTYFK